MRRVTEHFNLGATQSGVDFVDVDIDGDVPVYIDPASLRVQSGTWVNACVATIQSYFEELLTAIRADDDVRIWNLIAPLQEPNETHLGVSQGKSRGRSLGGAKKAKELISNLQRSKAAKSGFLRDLEDTALFVDGIDRDIISDITTCIIRQQLVEYTQGQCRFHDIRMRPQTSGHVWNAAALQWDEDQFTDLPRAADDVLLLVPKSIVRVKLSAEKGEYYRGYLRPYYEELELGRPQSEFVAILKDKRRKILKKKLDLTLGTTKSDLTRHTERFPQALEAFKKAVDEKARHPLSDGDIRDTIGTATESLSDILEEILVIPPGKAGANAYHRGVAKFLTLLFDAELGNQKIETSMHNGLKRIDITYDNVAGDGFFDWLRKNYPAAIVVVECKNYGKEMGNPEFDQIAMRLSPARGQFGLLVCRDLQDVTKARARSKAIAGDGHGYVVVLTDDDLRQMADSSDGSSSASSGRNPHALIAERFRDLLGIDGPGS